MRIVHNGYRDYYDVAMAHGQDFGLTYVRTRKTIDLSPLKHPPYTDPWPFPLLRGGRRYLPRGLSLNSVQHVVGFCGKLYGAIRLELGYRFDPRSGGTVCHSEKDVDAFLRVQLGPEEYAAYADPKPTGSRSFRDDGDNFVRTASGIRWGHPFNAAGVREWFAAVSAASKEHEGLFLEHRCPVFVATRGRIGFDETEYPDRSLVVNAPLRRMEFARVFDPYTAYQEISMYLGGLASPEKPIPKLSDEDMAHSKGHGDRYSFRRAPTKSRK